MSQPPHSSIQCQETLDIILTLAAFDQQISLLFLDQGIFQLMNNQNPDCLAMKDTAAIFKALTIYEVNRLYVEVESLHQYGLKPGDLLLPVQEIYRKKVSQLMRQHYIIF
jgi:tRNA 2-thiouridine synthesizing protein C